MKSQLRVESKRYLGKLAMDALCEFEAAMAVPTSSHRRQQRTAIKMTALKPLELIIGHAKCSPLGMVEVSLRSIIMAESIWLTRLNP